MTSCILQERLGLSTQCIAFDITSGCSGYVQGLSIASSMLSGGIIRKALLLAGDAIEHAISKNDKTTFPLFGSAGSATLLSFNPTSGRMFFEMGTDGRGSDAIMIRDGGCRFPFSSTSLIENLVSDRVSRCNTHLIMNGEDVFSFAISDVPSSIENLYKRFNLDVKYTDYYVFHQANKMILETIADIMDIPLSKVPMSLKKYGNTSSASIPMTIVSEIGSIKENTSFCLSGFGVGLSWGTVYLESTNIYCPDVIEI